MKEKLVTLRGAVVLAGMPTDRAALWRTFVVRHREDGGTEIRHVDLYKIFYRGRLENDIVLQPGDTVVVPMTILDGLASFVGRILGPIVGVGTSAMGKPVVP